MRKSKFSQWPRFPNSAMLNKFRTGRNRSAEATAAVAAPRHEHRLLLVVNARHVVAWTTRRLTARPLAPGHDLSWPARRRPRRPPGRSARSSSRRRPSRRWRAPRRRSGARRCAIWVLAELVLVLVLAASKDATHQSRAARLLLLRRAARPRWQVRRRRARCGSPRRARLVRRRSPRRRWRATRRARRRRARRCAPRRRRAARRARRGSTWRRRATVLAPSRWRRPMQSP